MKVSVIAMIAHFVKSYTQYANVQADRGKASYSANLDGYPVASFSSNNITECNNCCTFQNSSFGANLPYAVQIGDDYETQDPWVFVNGLLIRHVQNASLVTFLSGVNQYFTNAIINPSLGNYLVTDILNTTSCYWDLLGAETPSTEENFELEIARTGAQTGIQYYILTNNGTIESSRSYMAIFAVSTTTGQIIPGTMVKNFSFSADYGVRTMYLPNCFSYVDKNTIYFGTLSLTTGIINTPLSYNLTNIQLELKDYYLCNDSLSVVVVENHRGVDILSLTQKSNFMNSAKTWMTGTNTTFFVSSEGGLVVSIFNQATNQLELYYMVGNDYTSYGLVQVLYNGTAPVINAEETNAMVLFSDSDGFMYYYFKTIKYLAVMNYSSVSGSHIRGYLYNDTNSQDLQTVFTLVNLGPYPELEPLRVYPELVGFDLTKQYGNQPGYSCQFTNPSSPNSVLLISTLLTNWTVTIQWTNNTQQQQMSSLIKNVLITGTVILTMLLILGSFWLMSRKSKEEDAALEEFKLDYIKYSHKKPEHDDSSSLINHNDIN